MACGRVCASPSASIISKRAGFGWQIRATDVAREAHAIAVHELQHRGRDRLRHQPRHRLRGGPDIAIERAHGASLRRQGHEFQCGLDDQRQRAFAADQQTLQVVAGCALGGGAAAMDQFAAAGDRGQCEHVVAAGAVLHGARAAGVAGEVATDGAVGGAGRIRWPEQAVRLQRCLQLAVEHARFHHRATIARTHVEDAIHAFERHHHAAHDRHRRAGGVGAAPARDHRHAMGMTGAHEREHLFARGRQRHCIRQRFAARIVVGVGEALAGIAQPTAAEQGGEFAAQVGGQRSHVLRILPGVRLVCFESAQCLRRQRGSARRHGRSAIVGAKRVAQPVQARRCGVAVGFDHVEAAGGVGVLVVPRQKRLRGVHELAPLAGIDRGRAAAETGVAAVAHFDEHQRGRRRA